jgi:heterodisulfide reductase subunit A
MSRTSTVAADHDVLVVGGGIAGLQTALDLADRGRKVLVVEKEPSIGGKMIALSKVFPTMDCASCITTPRMSSAAHHDNVDVWVYSEIEELVPDAEGGFSATIRRKATYVSEDDCIGCRLCEYACPVEVPHEFEGRLGARRAAYIPFGTAIPQYALIDADECIFCGKCEKACPTTPTAIDFTQQDRVETLHFDAAVLATGYQTTPTEAKAEYHGEAANVLSGLDMERLLSPNGPYGRVLRPSDGKIPDRVAYVQCAGSRDETLGVPYCSRVCCMYAIKQAMLLSGSLPLADITIYYMDIRAFGKGYEQFYQTARAMGIEFVKAKVARIDEQPDGDLKLRIERMEGDGSVDEPLHDLVVLSVGMRPGTDPRSFVGVDLDKDGFIRPAEPKLDTTRTSMEGLFATGTAIAPKDIVDSVVEASAAAAKVEAYLASTVGARPQKAQTLVSVSEMGPEQLAAAGAIEEVHHGQ